YHVDLAQAIAKERNESDKLLNQHRDVFPKCILRVVSAFVVDQKYFPSAARQRATQALNHAIDEIAATFTIDRDLYSRCIELVPVIGFFGTVWGLSLAMLGASDVIRAQDTNWIYDLGQSFFTAELANSTERQQLALDGMLGALSIKFDTTGYALLLMFLLIVFGARATRREYRALSVLHSTINETTVIPLPTFGEDDEQIFEDRRIFDPDARGLPKPATGTQLLEGDTHELTAADRADGGEAIRRD
ncbi:MotA/TolQ/ExbB proton channel family protein, partial [Mesorhizobium sp.]|uniref:MotA/TolQ/ExbB proton channel family protein n=1 Tax=Mesorhizobium sp. TaxID=1871066 RepID=UPI000FEA10F8